MNKGIFITGTNTDIGKTYVSGCITKLLHEQGIACGYYKAALSGAPLINGTYLSEDALYVKDYAGLVDSDICVSHIYEHAYSPHLAASLEQRPFQMDTVKKDMQSFRQTHEFILAEGSGGIICPLLVEGDTCIMLSDVMKELTYPLLIVTNSGLGAINATLLTLSYAASLSLPITGVIMNNFDSNDPIHLDNYKMIEQLGKVTIVSVIPHNGTLSNPSLLLQKLL